MFLVENTILFFILAFAVGIIWYRVMFFIVPRHFKMPFTRTALKVQWHHLHWGIILILIGTAVLLRTGEIATLSATLIGLGLGFSVDLFIPSLLLETERKKELVVYRKTLRSTLILAVGIIAFFVIVSKI